MEVVIVIGSLLLGIAAVIFGGKRIMEALRDEIDSAINDLELLDENEVQRIVDDTLDQNSYVSEDELDRNLDDYIRHDDVEDNDWLNDNHRNLKALKAYAIHTHASLQEVVTFLKTHFPQLPEEALEELNEAITQSLDWKH